MVIWALVVEPLEYRIDIALLVTVKFFFLEYFEFEILISHMPFCQFCKSTPIKQFLISRKVKVINVSDQLFISRFVSVLVEKIIVIADSAYKQAFGKLVMLIVVIDGIVFHWCE